MAQDFVPWLGSTQVCTGRGLDIEWRHSKARTLLKQGYLDEAESLFREILSVDPRHAASWVDLGLVWEARQRWRDAEFAYRQAASAQPDFAQAHNNLGSVLNTQRRWKEAEAACRRAIALDAQLAEAHNNLGIALKAQGRLAESEVALRQALALLPDLAQIEANLAAVLRDQCRMNEASSHAWRAIELGLDDPRFHSYALSGEQYLPGVTPQRLAVLHAEWDRRHAAPLKRAWRPFSRDRDPQRALRLGFVSCDFREHPVGLFTIRALEGLKHQPSPPAPLPEGEGSKLPSPPDALPEGEGSKLPSPPAHLSAGEGSHLPSPPDALAEVEGSKLPSPPDALSAGEGSRDCEVVCYSDVSRPDGMTERFIAAADRWLDVRKLSDEALAEQIRNDRIDILFDLGGHTAGNRLLVFARKPAPVQVEWAGYAGSSGLAAVDYLLADRYQVEAGGEANYPGKVLRLPDGYVCFDAPADAPEVGPLPALAEGHVTFGSFNNPAKITPCVVAAWAEILRRVPGARLVLKYKGLDRGETRRHFEGLFLAGGVAPDRLEILGWSPRARMLAEYNRLDLALDPFPYSGGITTCEALWMGLPVITCPGRTFAGRHALSHLTNVGMTATVAWNLAEYVELAVQLAHDLPRLAKWRAELRGQVARSPLCDGPRFAANLMKTLRFGLL